MARRKRRFEFDEPPRKARKRFHRPAAKASEANSPAGKHAPPPSTDPPGPEDADDEPIGGEQPPKIPGKQTQAEEEEESEVVAVEPGFRPPRDQEVTIPLPDDELLTVSEKSSITPGELWFYSSGGSVRSAQTSLGAAWYLHKIDHWKDVTRIVSVSGGALTNAEFAARAHQGAADGEQGTPEMLLASFHRRLATAYRWAFWLLICVMVVLAVAALIAVWHMPQLARWLVDMSWFRWTLVVVLVASLLYLLWVMAKSWVKWLILVGTVTVVVVGVWLVLRAFGVPFDRRWLQWTATILLIIGVLFLYLVALQLGVRQLMRFRMRRILDGPGTEPGNLGEIDSGFAHIFSTCDFGSGHPLYFTAGPVGNAITAAVAIDDLSSPANAINYHDATTSSLRDTVYASAALPGLVTLKRMAVGPGLADPPQVTPGPGIYYFGQPEPAAPVPAKKFTVMDGGLNSTLGTRLDPLLSGLIDERGTMEAIDILYPGASSQTANYQVRRIVVDGGSYLNQSGLTKYAAQPGLSAILSLKRGINVANLSLLESDRQLADRPGTDIWYLPTTGGDQTFTLRFSAAAIGELRSAGRTTSAATNLEDLKLSAGLPDWQDPTATPALVPIMQMIARILLLKDSADLVSNLSGVAEYGYEALASGVATAFMEHRGIDVDPTPLERCLFDLDELLLRDSGNPNNILKGTSLPLAISHQGVRDPTVRGNTAAAFWAALDAGFSMLEVDVMLTRDGRLAALHPDATHTASTVRATDFDALGVADLVDLEQLLTPEANLFPNDANAVTKAADLGGAIWNVEAKDKASADAVADLLNSLPPEVGARVIFSGGWRIRPLRAFRQNTPGVLTACHWWEAVKLSFGLRVNTPAIIQLPAIEPTAWWARPFVIRRLRVAARHARAQGLAVVWFTVDDSYEAIEFRMIGPSHGYMTEGTDVLNWAIPIWSA